MPRAGALLGMAALLGLGGLAALPDDEPAYLGDMPSIQEQAEAAPSLPAPFVPPPPAPPPPRVDGPDAVQLETPAPVGPPVAAERIPAPVTDVPQSYRRGASDNGDDGSPTGLFELPPIPCLDTVVPGVGTIDCVTGVLVPLIPDVPELPVDPCSIELPLPVECPAVLPD